MMLASIFAIFALLLAALGIYVDKNQRGVAYPGLTRQKAGGQAPWAKLCRPYRADSRTGRDFDAELRHDL
jgi:hypothetical protein